MTAKIEVEETNLEDLIILGEDRLINIEIEYPTDDGRRVKAKAKVKQLTMKELKNINFNNPDLETSIQILDKSLYKQDETPFGKKLIEQLPVGVVTSISAKILELSGMDKDMGF